MFFAPRWRMRRRGVLCFKEFEMAEVALVKCDSYENAALATAKAIDLVGGVDAILKKEEKSLIFLQNVHPKRHVQLTPRFLGALQSTLSKKDIQISVTVIHRDMVTRLLLQRNAEFILLQTSMEYRLRILRAERRSLIPTGQ